MQIFTAEGVCISYKKFKNRVFKYPNFYLNQGFCLCIKGETGCGKTTLLNGLFGHELKSHLYYEKAEILGKDIKQNKNDLYKWVSYMPQFSQNALNPSVKIDQHIRDVEENCRDKADYKGIMESLRLRIDILNKYPYELSGGMKQRVVMMLGFIKKPKLIVLDEPSTAIDAITLTETLAFMQKAKSEGVSILIATHDSGFARHIADDYLYL